MGVSLALALSFSSLQIYELFPLGEELGVWYRLAWQIARIRDRGYYLFLFVCSRPPAPALDVPDTTLKWFVSPFLIPFLLPFLFKPSRAVNLIPWSPCYLKWGPETSRASINCSLEEKQNRRSTEQESAFSRCEFEKPYLRGIILTCLGKAFLWSFTHSPLFQCPFLSFVHQSHSL